MNTKLNFEQWHKTILESMEATPAPAKVESSTAPAQSAPSTNAEAAIDASPSKTEIIQDVDSIMNSLQKLSVQIKEALESIDVFENEEVIDINEEESILEKGGSSGGSDVLGKLADWMIYAPKYRKMQQKINKMKMNSLDIQIAVNNLTDEDIDPKTKKAKKEALSAKRDTLEDQIKDLQSAVNDKASERGEYIQKVLSAEKIKGQMALVQRSSGQEDDPAKKKSLADSMKELNQRYAEEQAAIKELTDKAKKTSSAKKTQAPKADKKTDSSKADKEAEDKAKAAELEADIADAGKNIEHERVSIEKANDALKTEKDPEKIAKLKDGIQKSKDDIEDIQKQINKFKSELSKISAKESLLFAANELGLNEMAIEIATKQDWQLENNSALYVKYNTEIEKQAAIKKINESHVGSTIADKFRMLLG